MAIGIILTLIGFLWALRNDQFQDQERARFLALGHEPGDAAKKRVSGMSRYEIYGLVCLACAGLGASGAVLVFALLNG